MAVMHYGLLQADIDLLYCIKDTWPVPAITLLQGGAGGSRKHLLLLFPTVCIQATIQGQLEVYKWPSLSWLPDDKILAACLTSHVK